MRSSRIHTAIGQGNSRFEICQLVAKGVKITHKSGERLEDSINNVLCMLQPKAPHAAAPKAVAI